jgi:hypothetical protein
MAATSQFINPEFYMKLSEEQICTWRKFTYSNLNNKYNFNANELLDLPNTEIFSLDEIKDSICDKMFYFKQSGIIKFKQSVFVMIDSCILGKYTLPTIITKFKKQYNLYNKNLILVVSNINKTENNYKIIKKNKYPCINFDKLQFNLDILNGNIQLKLKNIVIINTDISFDNKILLQEEINYLNNNQNWVKGIRNEINDIAQLEMLYTILNMFSNNHGFFITQDKNLLKKINIKANSFDRIHSFTF